MIQARFDNILLCRLKKKQVLLHMMQQNEVEIEQLQRQTIQFIAVNMQNDESSMTA